MRILDLTVVSRRSRKEGAKEEEGEKEDEGKQWVGRGVEMANIWRGEGGGGWMMKAPRLPLLLLMLLLLLLLLLLLMLPHRNKRREMQVERIKEQLETRAGNRRRKRLLESRERKG